MKKNKTLIIGGAVLSLILLFLSLLLNLNSLKAMVYLSIIVMFLAIVVIVLEVIGKKKAEDDKSLKIINTLAILVAVITLFIQAFNLIGINMIANATDCVKNNEETSICTFNGVEQEVPNGWLREDQMKEE